MRIQTLARRSDIELDQLVNDRPEPSLERLADLNELRQLLVNTILPDFTEKFRRVIPLLYGLNGHSILSQSETARALRMSETKVRCIKCLFLARCFAKWGHLLRHYDEDE